MGQTKTQEYAFGKDILKYVNNVLSFTATVDAAKVVADGQGRKILPAGSIVTGSLTDRDTKISAVNDATAIGITRYDVDVTDGENVVAVVFQGAVDLSALPVAPAAEAITAMKNITFMN